MNPDKNSSKENLGLNTKISLDSTKLKKKSRKVNKSLEEIAQEQIDFFNGAISGREAGRREFPELELSPDAQNRPLYVCPDGHIFLETFSPFYKPAYDFIVAIAEPVSRPKYIQEYQITLYSLFAAVSIGLTADEIIRVLSILSKSVITEDLINQIKTTANAVGKIKLVLKKNRYFIESTQLPLLKAFSLDEKIGPARIKSTNKEDTIDPSTGFILVNDEDDLETIIAGVGSSEVYGSKTRMLDELNIGPINETVKEAVIVRRFEIDPTKIEMVRKTALDLHLPLSDEYDFRHDPLIEDLGIDLKPATVIRPYQEKSLSKMFSGGRAKSGIIVLPCGAGKTLVGITAACTLNKSTIIMCNSAVPVTQWRSQFLQWTTAKRNQIILFTSEHKQLLPPGSCILITTYSMLGFGGHRSEDATKIIEQIKNRDWGLMIMDEVHEMPAESFRKCASIAKAHSKLGLTATLVREDEKIKDLNYLIGPKLYEANWIDLAEQGFIARVQCFEVWCKMTGPFYREYIKHDNEIGIRNILKAMNPEKFDTVERLIRYHEERGDKILVFSDIIWVLETYAKKIGRFVLHGGTSENERQEVFDKFRRGNKINTLFISRIGDKAIDLPDARVLIQICSHFGSRMQETQRLGRILRPKAGKSGEYNAYFYTLISEDTDDMMYSRKRQQFLIDQGYSFEVVQNQAERWPTGDPLSYEKPEAQSELLQKCLEANQADGKVETIDDPDHIGTESEKPSGRVSSSYLTGANPGAMYRNMPGARK